MKYLTIIIPNWFVQTQTRRTSPSQRSIGVHKTSCIKRFLIVTPGSNCCRKWNILFLMLH